jgi:hypothetical protein
VQGDAEVSEEVPGVAIIAKTALALYAIILLVVHFWMPDGEGASVVFVVALLFLTVAAITR